MPALLAPKINEPITKPIPTGPEANAAGIARAPLAIPKPAPVFLAAPIFKAGWTV